MRGPRAPTVSRAAMTAMMTKNPLADSVRARAQLLLAPVPVEEGSLTRNSMCKSIRSDLGGALGGFSI